MIVIGLTGGIGSGKSTVSDRFVDHGAILIDADQIVKELQQPDQIVYSEMVKHFGKDIFNEEDSLTTQYLSGKLQIPTPKIRRNLKDKISISGIDKSSTLSK